MSTSPPLSSLSSSRRRAASSSSRRLTLSASSFLVITDPQKEETAFLAFSLPTIFITTTGSERSCPTMSVSARRSSTQAGHSARVCAPCHSLPYNDGTQW